MFKTPFQYFPITQFHVIFNCQQSVGKGGAALPTIYHHIFMWFLCQYFLFADCCGQRWGGGQARHAVVLLLLLLFCLLLTSSAVLHRCFATSRVLYLHISASWRLFTSPSCKINLIREFHWTLSVWSADESGC